MGKAIPDILKEVSRNMRKNGTIAENVLWEKLRNRKLGVRFIRQSPIYVYTEDLGLDRYIIPDFYCPEKKFILEIDGPIHLQEDIFLHDREKEKILEAQGYTILRITNIQIQNNLSEVLNIIQLTISGL